jgi:hypothetical protein
MPAVDIISHCQFILCSSAAIESQILRRSVVDFLTDFLLPLCICLFSVHRINARAARAAGNEELVHVWTLLQATTAASAADLASEAAAFSPKAAGFRGHVAVSQRRDSMMGGDPSEGEEGGVQRRAGTRAWRQGAFGKVRRERGGKVEDTGNLSTHTQIASE